MSAGRAPEQPDTMRPIRLRPCFALICLALVAGLFGPRAEATAPSFQEAEAAYDRGDYEAALEGFLSLAEVGHAESQFWLGRMYELGDGVDVDPAAAVQWYLRAARRQHASAQFRLGGLYLNGQGVPADAAEALVWYRRSAEQGHVDAQYMLGILHLQGDAVGRDIETAVRWLIEAADNRDADAAALLGSIYLYGDGLAADPEQAYLFLSMSEQGGNSQARLLLARMYREGIGVDPDPELALQLVQRSASQGNALAMAQLIALYGDTAFRNRSGQLLYMAAALSLWTEAHRPRHLSAQALPPDMTELAEEVIRQTQRVVPVSIRREADAMVRQWQGLLRRAWIGELEPGEGTLMGGLNGPQPVFIRYLDGSFALAVHPERGLLTVAAPVPPRMTPAEMEGIGLGDYIPAAADPAPEATPGG